MLSNHQCWNCAGGFQDVGFPVRQDEHKPSQNVASRRTQSPSQRACISICCTAVSIRSVWPHTMSISFSHPSLNGLTAFSYSTSRDEKPSSCWMCARRQLKAALRCHISRNVSTSSSNRILRNVFSSRDAISQDCSILVSLFLLTIEMDRFYREMKTPSPRRGASARVVLADRPTV